MIKHKLVVFTNGCYDVLHPGHISLLRQAKLLGDILVVGLNSDASIRRLKGAGRPIFNERERVLILEALEAVDQVIVFEEDTPERLIKIIKPDILVKGEDWEEDNIVGARFVESYGGRVVRVPLVRGYSTTVIIERMRNKTK